MFDNPVLDVAIGLVFIFLMYSLLASTVSELIATFFSYRSKMLERGIKQMLDGLGDSEKDLKEGGSFSSCIINHPLYKRSADRKEKPSYLNADVFADILLNELKEKVAKHNGNGQTMETPLVLGNLAAYLNAMDVSKETGAVINSNLKKILYIYINQANGDIQRFRLAIESWYDDTMDRVSGWYKKKSSYILFWIGFGLAVIFNVDTIAITNKLSTDKTLREMMVTQATEYVKKHPDGITADINPAKIIAMNADSANVSDKDSNTIVLANNTSADNDLKKMNDSLATQLKTLKTVYDNSIAPLNTTMGIGWRDKSGTFDPYSKMRDNPLFILGWIITGFAVSLGAPLWFDLLNKFINLRGSGKKPESSNDTTPSKTKTVVDPRT